MRSALGGQCCHYNFPMPCYAFEFMQSESKLCHSSASSSSLSPPLVPIAPCRRSRSYPSQQPPIPAPSHAVTVLTAAQNTSDGSTQSLAHRLETDVTLDVLNPEQRAEIAVVLARAHQIRKRQIRIAAAPNTNQIGHFP